MLVLLGRVGHCGLMFRVEFPRRSIEHHIHSFCTSKMRVLALGCWGLSGKYAWSIDLIAGSFQGFELLRSFEVEEMIRVPCLRGGKELAQLSLLRHRRPHDCVFNLFLN